MAAPSAVPGRTPVIVAFLAAALVLCTLSLANLASLGRFMAAAEATERALRAQAALDDLTRDLRALQAETRGYLLFPDESHLSRARVADHAVDSSLLEGEKALSAAGLGERAPELRQAARDAAAFYRTLLEEGRLRGAAAATALAAGGQGVVLVDRVEALITGLHRDAVGGLDRSQAETREGARRSMLLLGAGTAGAVAGLAAFLALVLRGLARRRRDEAALRETEARWQFAIEGAGDGLWDWQVPASKVFFSRRWKEMLGYSESEIGDSLEEWSKRVHPDDLPWVSAELQRYLRGETEVYAAEHRVRCKDGSYKWILDRGAVVERAADGSPLRIVGTHTDVTERRRIRDELVVAQARLQAVMDGATQVSIIATDPEGHITLFNRGAENLLGYSAAEMTRQSSPSVLHVPEEVEARGRALSLAFNRRIEGFGVFVEYVNQGEHETREWTYVRKDGSRFPVSLTVTGLRDEAGRITGYLGIAVDITARREAELQLRRARDAAEALARAKAEFLANMSHEIRTPMNAVIGMTGLLLDTPLDPRQRELAETIRGAGDALLTVINDILDFSKMEAGQLIIEPMDFEPERVVEDCLQLFAPRAAEKGLELGALVHPSVPRVVRGDAGRIRQILSNLLSNAIKFTEKGEVVVGVDASEAGQQSMRLQFEVRDTGIGIPAHVQRKIFEAFSQADTSITRRFGGTGLGLAICRKLVELMGGEMGVESAPGRGARFWFALTLEKGSPRVEPPSEKPPRGMRVLIVDDTLINRQILSLQVESWGMKADTASGGEEALDLMRRAQEAGAPYPLVLTDMHMPDMDGLSLTRRLKELEPSVRIVLVTSLGQTQGMTGGADKPDAAVSKPVKKSTLLDSIMSVLDNETGGRAAPALAAGTETFPASWAVLRILVAEDNPVNQKVAMLQLQSLGCRADAVSDGREALEALSRIPYDIVFMDCQMPELDGFQATAELRRREQSGRRTVVIAMTANAIEGDRERCLEAGMDDYIAKPVRIETLASAIDRWYRPLDPAALAGLQELGDPAVVRDIVLEFIANGEKLLSEIRAGAGAGDLDAVCRAAHALKGSSGALGAKGVQDLCSRLESAARTGAAAEVPALLDGLGAEWPSARAALEKAMPAA